MARLRCTFTRDYEDPGGFIVIKSGTVMDVLDTKANALAAANYCNITGSAQNPSVLRPGGVIEALSNGAMGIVMPNGATYPLALAGGTIRAPLLAGVAQMVVNVDAGSDVAHAQVILTWNANGGTAAPDTINNTLASDRFRAASTNALVVRTGVAGDTGGKTLSFESEAGVNLTTLHVGLISNGASPYSVAASNTVTALEMVPLTFPNERNVVAARVLLAPHTGTNNRARQIIVIGYSL